MLRAQATMMQHTVWVFCAANTKLQYILISDRCVDSIKHKFYIFMVGAYTHIVRSSNTNRHAPFWPQESKSRKPNSQTWEFCLEIDIYFRNIGQKKVCSEPSLLNLFVSNANAVFFIWTHTTDIISLSQSLATHFLFLYLRPLAFESSFGVIS